MEIPAFIKDIVWFAMWIGSPITGLTLGFLYWFKVIKPKNEGRLITLESKMEQVILDVNRKAYKEDLITRNGELRFMTIHACQSLHHEYCRTLEDLKRDIDIRNDKIDRALDRISNQIAEQERERLLASGIHKAFIAAVKEKLDLQFTLPPNRF